MGWYSMMAGRWISLYAGLDDAGPLRTRNGEVSNSQFGITHAEGGCRCEARKMSLVHAPDIENAYSSRLLG